MYGVTANPTVNDALTTIDAQLATAYTEALGQVQQLLADEHEDTEVLHRYAKQLHQELERIEENRSRRSNEVFLRLAREASGQEPARPRRMAKSRLLR